jgi:hypothetical protein
LTWCNVETQMPSMHFKWCYKLHCKSCMQISSQSSWGGHLVHELLFHTRCLHPWECLWLLLCSHSRPFRNLVKTRRQTRRTCFYCSCAGLYELMFYLYCSSVYTGRYMESGAMFGFRGFHGPSEQAALASHQTTEYQGVSVGVSGGSWPIS